MTLTYEQLTKIDILDEFISTVDVNYLKSLTEADQIVSVLKGNGGGTSSILRQLVEEHQKVCTDLEELRYDFDLLLKVLNSTISNADFQALKYKHNIFN